MTLLHFVNCAALTFAPSYLTYRTKLADHGIRSILWGVVGYFLTQLCKLILAATIFSSYTIHDEAVFNWVDELASIALGILDIVGIHLALNRSGGQLSKKLGATGLGWATAHNIAYYAPGLWLKARSLQFSYEHIQNSIIANFNLLVLLSLAYLAYIVTYKKTSESSSISMAHILVASILACETVMKFLRVYVGLNAWSLLLVRGVYACVVAIITRRCWQNFQQNFKRD